MGSRVVTSSAVSDPNGIRQRAVYWVLLDGDRRLVTAGIVVGIVLGVWTIVSLELVAVGPDSSAATVFGSGLTSGVVTFITVALSVNQLILSRVFGSPNELVDRLEGTLSLRRNVERHARTPSSPNDPAAFLALIATTLIDKTVALRDAIEASASPPPAELTSAIADVAEYGRSIDDRLEGSAEIVDVLDVVLGAEYARNMTAIHHLRNAYDDSLSAEARVELQAVGDLLESIAVARQFFKTLSLQQDFAELSRLIVYAGLAALLVTVSLTLVYRTAAVTLPPTLMPAVVTLGIGVVVAPLAVFVAYVLRAATIARRTVSVGPFIPPSEQ